MTSPVTVARLLSQESLILEIFASRAARQIVRPLNQIDLTDPSDDGDSSLLNLYSKAAETAFWSMLMSLLVLVVMVVVFIRMERHLRVMSERPQRAE